MRLCFFYRKLNTTKVKMEINLGIIMQNYQ